MLETRLCRTFLDTPADRCIHRFFDCIEREAGITVRNADKARARLWLATRPKPHLSVGVAAKRGYWDLEHDALAEIREFLTALLPP